MIIEKYNAYQKIQQAKKENEKHILKKIKKYGFYPRPILFTAKRGWATSAIDRLIAIGKIKYVKKYDGYVKVNKEV